MSSDKEVLKSMGFDDSRINLALNKTGNSGLQPALDWLIDNADKTEEEINTNNGVKTEVIEPIEDANAEPDKSVNAQSLKCDECGKLLQSSAEAEAHAVRTGHSGFSESTEVIKPLTAEERKAEMEKVQEIMRKKRVEREEQDKKEQIERERSRRLMGREIHEAKSKFESDEIKRLAEQKRREKEEDRLYLQKLRDQIKQDREAKKAEQEKTQATTTVNKPVITPPKKPEVSYDSCRIQIRCSGGKGPFIGNYEAKDLFSKVVQAFSEHSGIPENTLEFRSGVPPPKKYSAADGEKTLSELGFCPSIVLNVATMLNPLNTIN